MNHLEKEVQKLKFDPNKFLNRLQRAGIVSDNCIVLADVARGDWPAVFRILKPVEPDTCLLCGASRDVCCC